MAVITSKRDWISSASGVLRNCNWLCSRSVFAYHDIHTYIQINFIYWQSFSKSVAETNGQSYDKYYVTRDPSTDDDFVAHKSAECWLLRSRCLSIQLPCYYAYESIISEFLTICSVIQGGAPFECNKPNYSFICACMGDGSALLLFGSRTQSNWITFVLTV
jgi:hypothetical protein